VPREGAGVSSGTWGVLWWYFLGGWVLAVVLLEETISLSLGGGNAVVVVVQGPGDLLYEHQGACG